MAAVMHDEEHKGGIHYARFACFLTKSWHVGWVYSGWDRMKRYNCVASDACFGVEPWTSYVMVRERIDILISDAGSDHEAHISSQSHYEGTIFAYGYKADIALPCVQYLLSSMLY